MVNGPPGSPTRDLADGDKSPEAALPRIIGALRHVLGAHPEISRAWVIERGSGFVLAVEGAPGAAPSDASRLEATLQEQADREVGRIIPMQVVCVQGAGPVARMTAEAVPFYVKLRET